MTTKVEVVDGAQRHIQRLGWQDEAVVGASVLHARGLIEGESVCQSSYREACLLPMAVILETWAREWLRLAGSEVAAGRAGLGWTIVGNSLAFGQVGERRKLA